MTKPSLEAPRQSFLLSEDERSKIAFRMSAARHRRGWMIWLLWAMIGSSLIFEDAQAGAWMALSILLTAPFWALFVVWPFLSLWLWVRDRHRSVISEERIDIENMTFTVLITFDNQALIAVSAIEAALGVKPPLPVAPEGMYKGVSLETCTLGALKQWAQRRDIENDVAADEQARKACQCFIELARRFGL